MPSFFFPKRQYKTITGREQESDVIAFQIRQSFKPGEVTPDQANKIGYALATRFLKGRHAFLVCTHCDKSHIHSHIIFNSTSLDCKRKFRDFLGSERAIARLSDTICLEHGLSIIENPKHGKKSYNKWLGDQVKPSHREMIRLVIDDALAKTPADFEAFLKLLLDTGYKIKRDKNIALRIKDQTHFIRLGSLGEEYSENVIRAVLAGEKAHKPRRKILQATPQKVSLFQYYLSGSNLPFIRSYQVRTSGRLNDLQVSKPSVTRALRLLTEEGLIRKNSCGEILATQKGASIAKKLCEKCKTLKALFEKNIGPISKFSCREAIRLSYSMSDEIVHAIQTYLAQSVDSDVPAVICK
jgi:Mn-dependent DtxR family transcriptional regulator